jgi:hypothetical protein
MAQKPAKLKVTKAVGAPYKLPSGAVMRKMFETDEGALKNRKLEEIVGLDAQVQLQFTINPPLGRLLCNRLPVNGRTRLWFHLKPLMLRK